MFFVFFDIKSWGPMAGLSCFYPSLECAARRANCWLIPFWCTCLQYQKNKKAMAHCDFAFGESTKNDLLGAMRVQFCRMYQISRFEFVKESWMHSCNSRPSVIIHQQVWLRSFKREVFNSYEIISRRRRSDVCEPDVCAHLLTSGPGGRLLEGSWGCTPASCSPSFCWLKMSILEFLRAKFASFWRG